MIMFPKRRSAKTSTTETRTTPKTSALLPGFRSSQKYASQRECEEKKDSNDVEPIVRVSTRRSPTQAASPTEKVTSVTVPVHVGSKKERVSMSAPVDLDISVLSEDSGDGNSPTEENVQQLLGLGLGGSNHNPTAEEEDNACLLFEDEDDDQSRGQACAAAPLRPPALRVSSPQELAYHVPDDLDHISVQRPPSEIDVDFDAVPPSPMRDPSVASGLAGGAPLLPQYPLLGFPSEVEVDFAPEFGMRTKLCDAERLVRVILGNQAATDGKFSSLEHGSILQAIRTFAVMKQELIELRQKAENKDGDPPAILTNLTSPGTTNNTNSFSTPGPSSPQSPETQEDDESYQRHRQALRTTRNALVTAAKKCHALEEQLKRANETIDRLQLEQTPNPYALSLEQSLHTTTSSATNTSAELEDILGKLHNVPAASVSRDDRERIRKYVLHMLESTKSANQEAALQQSQQREAESRRQLQAAEERIKSLETKLQRFQVNEIPDPLDEANRQLQIKDERIAQLEASQARLQSLVQLAVARSQPLQERNHSERFRKLEAEYQTLAESVHFLEGQAVSL